MFTITTFVSRALMQGVPIPTVARFLGYQQILILLRYAPATNREFEAAAERAGAAMDNICKDASVRARSGHHAM